MEYLVWGKNKGQRAGAKIVRTKAAALKLKAQWKRKFPTWTFYIRRAE